VAIPERDTTFAQLCGNWAASPQRVFRAHSECSEAITGTLNALAEFQELLRHFFTPR
jgi:hypothetical protein